MEDKSLTKKILIVTFLTFFITLSLGLLANYLFPKKSRIANINSQARLNSENSAINNPYNQAPKQTSPPTTVAINQVSVATNNDSLLNNSQTQNPQTRPSSKVVPISSQAPSPIPSKTSTPIPSPTPTSTPFISPTPLVSPSPTPTPQIDPTPTASTGPLSGDANDDGKVDNLDFEIWQNNYLKNTDRGYHDADFNSDGIVDGKDYAIWFNNYTG